MNLLMEERIYKLVDFFFQNQDKFNPITQRTPYYHMGATIVDSVLQSGMNYAYVVYPRINILLTKFYNYKSTSDFIILFQTISLNKLINWNNEKKLNLITKLSWLFFENNIENEDELSLWLDYNDNIVRLQQINGIGPKTIDYMKMLSGKPAIPIDRHLYRFLELAGIFVKTYEEANFIYREAAKIIGLSLYELDKKIWAYMSIKI